jgi:hypothetical protein
MAVGGVDSTERPQDRADVARYYAASSPTQVFNQAARQVAQERNSRGRCRRTPGLWP